MLAYLCWVSLSSSICASSSASTVRVPRPSRSDSSCRVNLYVLNDHARRLSSFDCVGDCGAERDVGAGGRSVVLPGDVALLTWSGVDSGMLLVARHVTKTDELTCMKTILSFTVFLPSPTWSVW